MRTRSLRPKILLVFFGVWMGVINFSCPDDAAGQTAALSTLAGSSAGSGGETSFGSRGSLPSVSPGDPLRLVLLGLSLLFVATFGRSKFKGHRPASRGGLHRPAGATAKPASGPVECLWIEIPAADSRPSGRLPQPFDFFDPCIVCAAQFTGRQGGMADSDQAVRCRMPH